MSNNGAYTPTVLPTPFSARGWEDFRAGRGYPADYETWPEKDQRHYERGRYRAAGVRLAGYRRVPASEPADIVQRTNGLKLVPRARRRDNRVLPSAPQQEWY